MATLNSADDNDNDGVSAGMIGSSQLAWHWLTWPKNLRQAVVIFAVVALIILGLIYEVGQKVEEFTQELQKEDGLKTQAQSRLRESGQERDTITKYLPLLHQLETNNIFGEEKRLEWVEQLRVIEKHWPGVSITYDISPQEMLLPDKGPGNSLPPSPTPPAGTLLPNGQPAMSFAVFDTRMKLTLQVLHEGDVLAILSELKGANLGLFTTRQCSLRRLAGSDSSNNPIGLGEPLTVNCNLIWISMRAFKDKI